MTKEYMLYRLQKLGFKIYPQGDEVLIKRKHRGETEEYKGLLRNVYKKVFGYG